MVAAPFQWYPHGLSRFFAGDLDWDAQTFKIGLATSSYTPSPSHDDWGDVTAFEASGTGYTARGQALTTKTNTVVVASAVTNWAATTAYAVRNVVEPTTPNGHIYTAVVAGTSAGSEPTWPIVSRQTVTDGSVTWAEAGSGFVALDSDPVTWTITTTLTYRYAILYKDTGTNSTSYLVAYANIGSDETASGGGTITITPDAVGWVRITAGT